MSFRSDEYLVAAARVVVDGGSELGACAHVCALKSSSLDQPDIFSGSLICKWIEPNLPIA